MAIRTIVVPYDFSNDSELALATVYDLGGQLGAELHLVHVIESERDSTAERQAAEQLMAVVLPAQELHYRVHRAVLLGSVHQELAKYAEKCRADLIVMGTRGRFGILKLALGSVAQRVLRTAYCPVVLVTA